MLGKSQLQACPAKVMLFPGIPQSVLPSVHCRHCKVGGDLGWSCLCGHPSSPLHFSPICFLHPWPAISSPQQQQISVLFYPSFALFHKAFCRLFGMYKSSHAG